MPVSLLTPRSLTDMVNEIVPIKPFILDLVFKRRKQFFTEVVDVPIRKHKRNLARFSRRTSQANIADKVDYEIKSIKLPHIREKMPSSAATALTQANLGVGIYAGKSQMDAYKMNVADDLATLKERALASMEWMACQALSGTISIVAADGDFNFDFGFDPSHKPVLTGTAQWDDSAKDITGNLRAWKRVVSADFGTAPDICIMGTNASEKFISDATVQKNLDNNNYAVGRLMLESSEIAGNYIGRYLGLDIYEYGQEYLDNNGNSQNMFSPDAVVLLSSSAPNARYFAPVNDLKAGLLPVEFFSKSWEEEDPSQTWVLAETNPLTVIENPNSILYATVL